jgi:hypothetical protein
MKFAIEAYKTAALLDGFTVIEIVGEANTRYVHWCGENPRFSSYLRVWGEAGMVKIKTNKTPKLSNRSILCVFVGYAWGIREILIECGIQTPVAYTKQGM